MIYQVFTLISILPNYLGHVAQTLFMISVKLNLEQKLNQVHAVLRCTKLISDQLISFS